MVDKRLWERAERFQEENLEWWAGVSVENIYKAMCSLRDRAVAACEELDEDLSEEEEEEAIADVTMALMRRYALDQAAIVEEVMTEEEIRRFYQEGFNRMDTGEGVEAEALDKAVLKRLYQEHAYFFNRLRPGAQTNE